VVTEALGARDILGIDDVPDLKKFIISNAANDIGHLY
jgi:hypothetical protein